MLPALVEPDATVVHGAPGRTRTQAIGRTLETLYRRDTFDAGYPCSLGVPTVMCGPSTSDFGGHGVLGRRDPPLRAPAVRRLLAATAPRILRPACWSGCPAS